MSVCPYCESDECDTDCYACSRENGFRRPTAAELRGHRKPPWFAGPPRNRGHWWIVWRGVVVPVEIGPALINRDDPNARLLIKPLGGMAYDLVANAPTITHHAVLEGPEAP